jgi:imidazolonepropionase-like amidohydrolase
MPFGAKQPKKADTLLIIHAGQLLAEPGSSPLRQKSVIVRNDRIMEIRDGFVAAETIAANGAQVEVLDLSQMFVLPGLFDSHVHLSRATGSYQGGFDSVNTPPPIAEASVNAVINAQLTLAAGFTSVRDLGSDPESVFAVRDAINNGHVTGPNIIASGASIGVTAGHGDDAATSDPDEKARAGVCDGPDECRTLARYLQKTGSDLIKIKITGGFSSNSGLRQHMDADEMRAIINAAHMRGIKVTAHAYESAAVADAVAAGVDSIEHGYLLDEKTLKLMKENDVFLVPTLTVAQPPSMVKRFLRGREPLSVTLRNEYQAFETAYRLGVKVAFGTDCGIYPHGENVDEMLEMVRLGMSPADVLRSATVVAAELFGIEDADGTIKAGNKADIIAVQGNPLDDIESLEDVVYVIKSGQVVKRDGIMRPPIDLSLPQKY